MIVQRLEANKAGKDYIIGDLHGCVTTLYAAMNHLQFDPRVDRIISTGDLIDRGPDSIECLELLHEPWFYAVKGNHEQMMEHHHDHYIRKTWFRHGGTWAIGLGTDHFMELCDLISDMPIVIVVGEGVDRYQVVHAEPNHRAGFITDVHIDDTPPQAVTDDKSVMWSRELFYYPNYFAIDPDLSTTYVGHNPTTTLVRTGPIFYLDRYVVGADMFPQACLAIACHTDGVIHEYYPNTDTLTTTTRNDIPDMLHSSFDTEYAQFNTPSPPPRHTS